jgi:hypothetical protein
MGLLNKLIILYFFTAIYLFIGGVQTPFTGLMTGTLDWNTAIADVFGVVSLAFGAMAIVASAVFSGGITIYVLIAPICVFLATFLTFPSTLFNSGGLPVELVGTVANPGFLRLVYYALNFLFGLAIVSWFKGSE